ncbi:MAG: hypothetical protein ACRD2Z_16415 [Thermoanaerobaculia bacterium]
MAARSRLAVAALSVLAGMQVAAQTKIHLREVCDSRTVLTLIGADVEAGLLLLSMRSQQAAIPGWMVELDTTVGRARLHIRDPAEGRAGGSVAPGPVLTALPCGTACRRLEAWRDGRWTAIGPPLSVSPRGTLETGYDGSGRPWTVVVETAGRRGRVRVAAARLETRIWRPQGRLTVDGLGFPAILPSPSDPEAILVGSGRFSPAAVPGPWLQAFPADGTGSQVLPIGGDAAAWLDDDGSLLLTRDRGRTWRRSRRTRKDPVGGWVHELRADLPLHPVQGRLPALWASRDAEEVDRPTLDLTAWSPDRGWQDVARLSDAYPSGVSPEFAPQQVLVRGDGHWFFVGACADTPTGAALELVTIEPNGRAKTLRPRLDPAWLDASD